MNFTLRVEGVEMPSLLATVENQPRLAVLHKTNF
jgi:hypothetical protein